MRGATDKSRPVLRGPHPWSHIRCGGEGVRVLPSLVLSTAPPCDLRRRRTFRHAAFDDLVVMHNPISCCWNWQRRYVRLGKFKVFDTNEPTRWCPGQATNSRTLYPGGFQLTCWFCLSLRPLHVRSGSPWQSKTDHVVSTRRADVCTGQGS